MSKDDHGSEDQLSLMELNAPKEQPSSSIRKIELDSLHERETVPGGFDSSVLNGPKEAQRDALDGDELDLDDDGDDDTLVAGPSDSEQSSHRGGFAQTRLDELIRDPRRNRIAGAVLGAAIGDALGNPTEFIGSFDAIRAKYGPTGVTGFTLYRDGANGRFAPFTDDTQMAEVVLRSLLWSREQGADLDATMTHMGKGFVEWAKYPKGGHRAPGNACLSGCRALEKGIHWAEAGGARAGGCGSVMRAYPFGLLFSDDLRRAEDWSVAHSKLTHGDPIALAASAAMAIGMARTFRGESLGLVLSEMIAAACRYSAKTGEMMARAWDEAQSDADTEMTLERLQGWAAHEAIAAAVYLFARHPDDPRAAMLEAANTPGDSDSLATLAGALTGCRAGLGAIPEEWVRDVERSPEFIGLAQRI